MSYTLKLITTGDTTMTKKKKKDKYDATIKVNFVNELAEKFKEMTKDGYESGQQGFDEFLKVILETPIEKNDRYDPSSETAIMYRIDSKTKKKILKKAANHNMNASELFRKVFKAVS